MIRTASLRACMEVRLRRRGKRGHFLTRQRSGKLPRLRAPRVWWTTTFPEWGMATHRLDTQEGGGYRRSMWRKATGNLDRTGRPAGRQPRGAGTPSMARRLRRAGGGCAAVLTLSVATMPSAEPSSTACPEGQTGVAVPIGIVPPDGDVRPSASRDEKLCGSEELGSPPFVQEFLKLGEATDKLRHLRTWTPELAERNCISEVYAYHFHSLLKLYVLYHGPGDELDCAALADNLKNAFPRHSPNGTDSWDTVGTGYFAVYRMFDVVVRDLCPSAPTLSCRGFGCPSHLR